MMESSLAVDQEPTRYPLSFTQEWFIGLDQGDDGGTFGPRFLLVYAIRITGQVDLAVLRGALDDVVARHELLRTLVVRDADPPYQRVFPPCRVPLEIRDLAPVTGESRDAVVQKLIIQAQLGSISAREVPLIKALLGRFDDQDSALFLTVHHSVSDALSMQIILRDLGAFYAARRTGTAAELPPMKQYREYAQWQRASAASTADDGAPSYWQHKLDGGREFEIPNDHGHPERYSRPYSGHGYVFGPELAAPASDFATATRSTLFTVTLSAFYVLAYTLTGDTDLAIRAFTAGGRTEFEFQNTMGLFLNCVPFRTDIAACTSFRDIVMATRETFIDAIASELPVNVIEQTFPDFIKPRENLRTSQFILSDTPSASGDDPIFPIADGACGVSAGQSQEEESDIPSGVVWHLGLGSDKLLGHIQFNLDEFDENTVAGWVAGLRRILAGGISEPDQDWRLLAGPASARENRD